MSVYVVMPGQLGLDSFDLTDALGNRRNTPISRPCRVHRMFIWTCRGMGAETPAMPLAATNDSDHVYNTPAPGTCCVPEPYHLGVGRSGCTDYTPCPTICPGARVVPERR